jgi:hypothetical protein
VNRLDRARRARYKRWMPLLAFIESREPFDDRSEPAREPWLLTAMDWLLPWPAAIVWLTVASRFADGWLGVGLIFGAIALAAWRGLRALPTDGLNQDRQ